MNNYYSVKLKKDRLYVLFNHKNSKNSYFKKVSIDNYNSLKKIFLKFKPSIVVNLAKTSWCKTFVKKLDYVKSNLVGFSNILILSRNLK